MGKGTITESLLAHTHLLTKIQAPTSCTYVVKTRCDRTEHPLTHDFPDHPQRVVQRRCIRRISRLKRTQSRRSRCELQEATLQLLRGIPATLRTPSLHSRRHNLRPHKHFAMDQEARDQPRRWHTHEERGFNQAEVCEER
jgi:hypothetical protein